MVSKSSTFRHLIYLLSVFIIGIISLIVLHLFFLSLVEKLDKQTEHLKTKIKIGEYIVEDFYRIRSDFFELAATTTNKRGRANVLNRLNEKIKSVHKSLDILENGGVLKRTIRLNIAGHNDIVKTVYYQINQNGELSLEVIDVRPKLNELKSMISTVVVMLEKRQIYKKNVESNNFVKISRKIRSYYKAAPAFFVRMTENVRRLLYEGEIELAKLQFEINNQKKQYEQLEATLIAVILLIVLILGWIVAKQINKNTEELQHQQAFIRGILDAQTNIIVVSDGYEMIDANNSLVEFFDGYNSFQDFKDEHACICDFFEDIENDEYITNKDYNGLNWAEYILSNPESIHKVALKKNDKIHHFIISAQKKILNSNNFIIIVSLNDITKEVLAQLELKQLNDNLENIVQEKTKELQELNENLEQRIIIEVDKNRKKDQQMIQQSRFAALGEMIGNIAHQWRQPLSAISSTSSSMQLQMQLGVATDEDIERSYVDIMGYVQFLTQTIEDFRGFFKEDKEEVEFILNDVLDKSISITGAAYKDNNIMLNKNFSSEKLKCFGFPNELSQVFLNVLNNAKDALLEQKLKNKKVYLKTITEGENNVVYIQDNAGGIPKTAIDKVFDPYFTTKHQTQGTGIGLYMSKEIVEKHMKGSISVKNQDIEVDGERYIGACFRIALPKV